MEIKNQYTKLLREWFRKYLVKFLITMRRINVLLGVIIAVEIMMLKYNEIILKMGMIVEVNIMQMYMKQVFFFTLGVVLCLVCIMAYYENAYEDLNKLIVSYGFAMEDLEDGL